MKKFLFVFIVCILTLSFIAYGDKGDSIKIETEIGFDKSFKPFYTTPIFITMDNNLKDIDGEIQIEVPYDEGYGNEVTIYAIGINHPKNTQKEYIMNIPLSSSLLNVKLKVVEDKKILLEKYVRIDKGISENTMLVGVLSDNIDSISYLNGFTYDGLYDTVSTKIVRLKEGTFPDSLDVMNNFDMIIINNFNTGSLTKEQYEVLKNWTESGGFLVIGTGANGSKTLSAFTAADSFIIGEMGDIKKASGRPLGYFVDDEFNIPIDILDINIEGGAIVVSSEEISYIQKLDKGQGRVLFLSFDLGMEPMISWKLNKYFMESLFQSTVPLIRVGPDYESKYRPGFNHNINSALNNIPELPLPKYGTIIIIFIIYIIIVAPLSYIVLKKKDKRELMWGIVPVFSIIFALIVYFVGFGSRIKEPLLNTVSVIRLNENGAYDIKYYAGIFTPNKTMLKIQGLEGQKIKPFSRNNYYGYNSSQTWDDKRIESKFVLYPNPRAEFYDIGVWGMKTFEIEDSKNIKGNIIGDIKYVDWDYSGFIENNTDIALEDCAIVTANQYIKMGDIKPGGETAIPKGMVQYYSNRHEFMDNLYPRIYQRYNKVKDEELVALRLGNKKRDMLDYFFYNEGQKIEGIKLIGWSKTRILDDISVNDKILKRYDNTMVVVDLKLNVKSGNMVELPFGYIEPIIVQDNFTKGHHDLYSNIYYGDGTVEFLFVIDEYIEPNSIKIKFENPSYNIKQFIWDGKSLTWEEKELSNFAIEDKEMGKYIDGNNELRLKFELRDDGNGIALPQISVKGSVR